MRTLAQTGNGWMTFKDASQPQVATRPAQPEQRRAPLEPLHRDHRGHQPRPRPRSATSARSTSAPLRRRDGDASTSTSSRAIVRIAVPYLDRVIDLNYYPIRRAAATPTAAGGRSGSGVMGLQDVFFQLRLPFDSRRGARAVARRSPKRSTSTRCRPRRELAEQRGPHPAFAETRAAQGRAAVRLWGVTPDRPGALGRAARRASPSTACATRC